MIGIKNKTGKPIKGRYDGKDYTFPPDAKVVTPISDEAARHIFGFGEKDKTRALLRLGWISNGANLEGALERLADIQFLAAEEPKFRDDEPAGELPRGVTSTEPAAELSEEEQAIARKLAKPEGTAKQFAKT